jgi:hypothetical protein
MNVIPCASDILNAFHKFLVHLGLLVGASWLVVTSLCHKPAGGDRVLLASTARTQ